MTIIVFVLTSIMLVGDFILFRKTIKARDELKKLKKEGNTDV